MKALVLALVLGASAFADVGPQKATPCKDIKAAAEAAKKEEAKADAKPADAQAPVVAPAK